MPSIKGFESNKQNTEETGDMHCNQKCSESSTKFRTEGNVLFTKKLDDDTCMEVLSLYSKSIAFAFDNSEEFALGLGNRSAILYHMQKFQECILDIEKALIITKSEKLKVKLFSRKASCLELMKKAKLELNQTESRKESGKSKLPKMIASNKVPCISENFSLKYNKKYGKHIIAQKDIKPGEVIAEEEAFIVYPEFNKFYILCSHCLSKTLNGIPCNFCSRMMYCSENCKTKAWKQYHDIECSIIQKISLNNSIKNAEYMENKFKFALRFFIKSVKYHSLEKIIEELKNSKMNVKEDVFNCKQFKSCYSMACNLSNEQHLFYICLYEEVVFESVRLLCQFKNIFTDEVRSNFESENVMFVFIANLLMKFLKINLHNAYMFQSTNCQCCGLESIAKLTCGINCSRRGHIIVPCCSLFNHSCLPNAQRIFVEKSKIILISTQPIKKGEQVYINYLDGVISVLNSKAERQKVLQMGFNFICDCQPCSENWPALNLKWKGPDPIIISDIFIENMKFCRSKGIEPTSFGDLKKLPCNKNTLCQILNLVEEILKKSNSYDALIPLFECKSFISRAFMELYGI